MLVSEASRTCDVLLKVAICHIGGEHTLYVAVAATHILDDDRFSRAA